MPNFNRSYLIGLCTVAVTAIYSAGYLYTEPSVQAGGLNSSAAVSPLASSHAPNRSNAASTGATPARSGKSEGHATNPKKTLPASTYRDGLYTGAGSNPYGTLTVAVRIAQGKIASVRITSYTMHYPQSFIDPQMPDEVRKMQTWRVYIVSGATASSYNFAEAVYYALKKAKV